jgi:hypothetical protein
MPHRNVNNLKNEENGEAANNNNNNYYYCCYFVFGFWQFVERAGLLIFRRNMLRV